MLKLPTWCFGMQQVNARSNYVSLKRSVFKNFVVGYEGAMRDLALKFVIAPLRFVLSNLSTHSTCFS
ncbi:hypothetical protein Scep_015039 [Stephania cephalantha]|uniref:Uncharacterized protein n=1 Tax=Stephania cephalantha TaxID=152367 RepID=A0AAP0J2I2_9MAGN